MTITEDNISIDSELIIEDDRITAHLETWFDEAKRFNIIKTDKKETIGLCADYFPKDGRLDVYYFHKDADGEMIADETVGDISNSERNAILKIMKEAGLDECIAVMNEDQNAGMGMK